MIDPATSKIYFIKPVGADGPFKIGVSSVPESRLVDLMIWSPVPLEIVASVPGTFRLEQNIHACLARSLSHGEWFFATDDVKAFVAKIVAGVPVDQAIDLTVKFPLNKAANGKRSRAWTPAHRAYLGNLHRVRHAENRASKLMGVKFYAPKAVFDALMAMQPPALDSKTAEYRDRVPDLSGQHLIDQFVDDPLAFDFLAAPSDKQRSAQQ